MEQNFNDDEYKFSEEKSSNLYSSAALGTKRSNIGATIKRILLITIGLVVVALAVYKVLGEVFAPKPKQPQTIAAPLQPKPIKKVEAPEIALGKRLQGLQQTSKAREDRMVEMFKAMQRFEGTMKSLNDKIADLNARFVNLNEQMQQQEVQIQALKKKQVRRRRVARRRTVTSAPRKQVFIQAIIPGRAWLNTQDGTPFTVQQGDRVPGYGVVRMIDPNRGRVTTSTGAVIRFSPQDR